MHFFKSHSSNSYIPHISGYNLHLPPAMWGYLEKGNRCFFCFNKCDPSYSCYTWIEHPASSLEGKLPNMLLYPQLILDLRLMNNCLWEINRSYLQNFIVSPLLLLPYLLIAKYKNLHNDLFPHLLLLLLLLFVCRLVLWAYNKLQKPWEKLQK